MESNNSKILIQAFAELVSGLVDADKNKDRKISIGEIWRLIRLFMGRIGKVSKNWKVSLNELRRLRPEEKGVLVAEFRQKFDLQDDEAEILIEDWIENLVILSTLIERTSRKIYKNKK